MPPAANDRASTTPGTTGDVPNLETSFPPWAVFARDIVGRVFTRQDDRPFRTGDYSDKDRGCHVVFDAAASEMDLADLLETVRRAYAPQPAPAPTAPMRLAERWVGVVDKVGDDTFEAHFSEVGSDAVQYQGDFLISALSEEDKQMIRAGMSFYAVRSQIEVFPGHWQETTMLRLRHLGRVTDKHFDRAAEQGATWSALLRERAQSDDA
jgi:hypothetical protein